MVWKEKGNQKKTVNFTLWSVYWGRLRVGGLLISGRKCRRWNEHMGKSTSTWRSEMSYLRVVPGPPKSLEKNIIKPFLRRNACLFQPCTLHYPPCGTPNILYLILSPPHSISFYSFAFVPSLPHTPPSLIFPSFCFPPTLRNTWRSFSFMLTPTQSPTDWLHYSSKWVPAPPDHSGLSSQFFTRMWSSRINRSDWKECDTIIVISC